MKRIIVFRISSFILILLIVFTFIVGVTGACRKTDRLNKHTLAVVNGRTIRESYFNEMFEALPEQHKTVYVYDKEGFLDRLIVEILLINEAKRLGFEKDVQGMKKEEEANTALIERFITHITSSVEVSEDEIAAFYDDNSEQLGEVPLEQVRDSVMSYLLVQKQNKAIEKYIKDLQNNAAIRKNEKWIAKQAALVEDPLEQTLNNSKPSMVDFGSDSCIPCKMMKPILEELQEKYRGKADIVIVDVYRYRKIASQYGIRAIPTQIFFDESGKEIWRHEGFLSKEEIVKKLDEMGVN